MPTLDPIKGAIKIGKDFDAAPKGVRLLTRTRGANKKGVKKKVEDHAVKGVPIIRKDRIQYKHEIQEVRNAMADLVNSKKVTKEKVVDEICKIAFSSTVDLGDGLVMTTKDKLKALDMLSKWLGLYEKDNAQKAAQNALLQVAFVGGDVLEREIKETLKRESLLEDSIWEEEEQRDLE